MATQGGTTLVGIRQNEYANVILTVGNTTGVGALAGISVSTCAASSYFWIQRKGMVAAMSDNTQPIISVCVTASTTVAGAVGVMNITASSTAGNMVSKGNQVVGICSVAPADSGEYTLIDMCLE